MCIRDSRYPDQKFGLIRLPKFYADFEEGRRSCADDVATEAVSYTHLRAHETVLDLVCRLLLEKKKKSKIKTTINSIYEIN